jgi:hypothetical protein
LALSNGRLIAEATPPAIKLAITNPVNGLFGRRTLIFFFASSYVVNIPRFKLIALIIVGVHPVHSPNMPSSAGIRFAASKKFRYPRL